MSAAAQGTETAKARIVQACNFRYAGRLSNDNARTLTALQEKFASNVSSSLEVYLGAALKVKLLTLEQMAVQDYIAGLAANSYLLPCAMYGMESSFLLEMDVPLIFPIIDLLLGGAGALADRERELTEIDEEIMQSVGHLIVQQLERAWKALDLTLTPGHCIRATALAQVFPANEKLVLQVFEVEVGSTTGHLKMVLPTSFVGYLIRNLKATQSKKRLNLRQFPNPSLRDRMLECAFLVRSDITKMRVLVKDLIDLQPGSVLKMRAPVKLPGRLTVEEVDIFEASPVRSGTMKAAQLLGRSAEPATTRE